MNKHIYLSLAVAMLFSAAAQAKHSPMPPVAPSQAPAQKFFRGMHPAGAVQPMVIDDTAYVFQLPVQVIMPDNKPCPPKKINKRYQNVLKSIAGSDMPRPLRQFLAKQAEQDYQLSMRQAYEKIRLHMQQACERIPYHCDLMAHPQAKKIIKKMRKI